MAGKSKMTQIDIYTNSARSRSKRTLLRDARRLMDRGPQIIRSLSQNVAIRVVKNTWNRNVPEYIDFSPEDFLSWWITSTGCKRKASNILLRYVKYKFNVEIPTDYRTLLKTPVTPIPTYIEPGNYIHVGVHQALYGLFLQAGSLSPGTILMQFFIDGVKISNSTKNTLWLIMINIRKVSRQRLVPRVVGCYYGETQPNNFNDFLWPFVMELLDILDNGISFKGTVYFPKILNFVLDAKARVACKAIKSINAYYGCDVCLVEGDAIDGRMAYLDLDAPIRNDKDYRSRVYDVYDYHHMESVLELLPINMLLAFPLDYLHCLLLGVMKWILKYILYTPRMLSNLDYVTISQRCKSFERTRPVEFQHELRPFTEYFGLMKGTEFRQHVLFVAPLLLEGIVDEEKIVHLMKLQIASIIFTHQRFYIYYNEAHELMKMFILELAELYHPRHVVYTFHSLCHMKMFVDEYGPWDNFSTFEYESYNCTVKNLLKGRFMPLTQLTNRINEIYAAPQFNIKGNVHEIEISSQLENGGFSRFEYYDLLFKTDVVGQNFALLKSGKAVQILSIHQERSEVKLIGKPFKEWSSVYKEVDTTRFNIFKSKPIFDKPITFHVSDIDGKFWELDMPNSNYKAYFPIYVEDGKSFSGGDVQNE